MKLGISHLAFDSHTELFNIASYLKQNKILNIEIVIPKIIDWDNLNYKTLQNYIQDLKKIGLSCSSTQSITFNKTLASFCSEDFFSHLKKVSEVCLSVEINTLVLGAPKLRTFFDQDHLSHNFEILDYLLRSNGQTLCIEPNCSSYGGLYFTTLQSIVDFLKANKFTNIKTMIDVHNLTQEGFNPSQQYTEYEEYIHHVHVSEIGLGLFKPSNIHTEFSECLEQHKYKGIITYEVMNSPNVYSLLDSITQFKNTYNLSNIKDENNL